MQDYLEVRVDGKKAVLFHFPILSWNAAHHGRLHLHGHSHGHLPGSDQRIDVGVDCWELHPASVDEINDRRKLCRHGGQSTSTGSSCSGLCAGAQTSRNGHGFSRDSSIQGHGMDFNTVHGIAKDNPSIGDVHIASTQWPRRRRRSRHIALTTIDSAKGPHHLSGPTDITSFNDVDLSKRSPRVGDTITVENDTGSASNAPWTSKVVEADGWRVKVANDDGEAWYSFDRRNLTGVERGRRKGGAARWVFAKHDLPAVKSYEVGGIRIEIETPIGHRRIMATAAGESHDVVFDKADYGRIPDTVGADGDQVDVFVGPNHDSDRVWAINQIEAGFFDEVKIMAGFTKKKQAIAAYEQGHFDGRSKERLGEIIKTSFPDLKKWLDAGPAVTRDPYPGGALHLDWSAEDAKDRERLAQLQKRGMPEGKDGRALQPFARGMAKNPLPVHRHAMSQIRPDQTPRVLEALTHPDMLDQRKMKIGDLTAIQDRVDPQKVRAMIDGEHDMAKKPVVVRFAGRNYVVDGDHHVAARWLMGKNKVKVRFKDVTPMSEAIKRAPAHNGAGKPLAFNIDQPRTDNCKLDMSISLNVRKSNPDQRLIFGWASVSSINGELVTDKQGDQIPIEELEKAAHDFVLYSRDMGHLHEKRGVGRLVSSLVFSRELQKTLNIDLGMEGWFVGFYVDDDDVWAACKRGDLPEFSIGGVAVPVEV